MHYNAQVSWDRLQEHAQVVLQRDRAQDSIYDDFAQLVSADHIGHGTLSDKHYIFWQEKRHVFKSGDDRDVSERWTNSNN